MRNVGARVLVLSAVVLTAGLLAAAQLTAPSRPDPIPARAADADAGARPEDSVSDPDRPAPAPAGASASTAGVDDTRAPANGDEENQMAFAYPATDIPALAARLGEVGGAVQRLGESAQSYSIAAMKEAAAEVQSLAAGTLGYANAAHARLATLTPSDPALGQVWADALAAYVQVRTHAGAALELAEFGLTLDPTKAGAATESILSLGDGETGLLQTLESLRTTLESWSGAHGSTATAALNRFGTPAA